MAPSPKKATPISSVPRARALKPAPTADGMPPPTRPLVPNNPQDASYKCIVPPRPPQQPSRLPYSSAIRVLGDIPLASAWPWPRWVLVIQSVLRRWAQTPTPEASWPMYKCRKPGVSPLRQATWAASSKRRNSSICSYKRNNSAGSRPCGSSCKAIPVDAWFMATSTL